MINGIPKSTEDQIIKVLSQCLAVESVIAHGSRSKNTHRQCSSIDLALRGSKLDFQTLLSLDNQIDDLLLPYKIDLCLYDTLQDPLMKNEIKKWGQVIYKQKNTTQTIP